MVIAGCKAEIVSKMTSNMIVSVVVPVYNRKEYVGRCINSILKQTYRNLDIILVDDGSTDGSADILDSYADMDDRIRVIHKTNGGLSDARNAGIDSAKGEYICFVDADDSVNEHYIEYMLKACIDHNCDMAICRYKNVYRDDSIDYSDAPEYSVEIKTSIEALEDIYSIRNVETIVAWNKIYRASLFEDVRYPIGRIHEDEATTPLLIYAADRVARIDAELYYYLQNDSGITGSEFSAKRLDILWAIEKRMEFYKSEGLTELYYKDLYKYLQKLLICHYKISRSKDNDRAIKSELMKKYRNAYKLSVNAAWSEKRRMALRIFSVLPDLYYLIRVKETDSV